MKITIEGSSKELAEIAKVLSVVENKAKSDGFPTLLTELASEKFSVDELTPSKPYTAEPADEIAEITRPENLITSEFYSSPFFL
ncbi:MAG: hypothetical protein K2N06_02440 [Oscillospiraceae bacterium]|nr:hypothetical protein [Oscillospiraceae bacterium]